MCLLRCFDEDDNSATMSSMGLGASSGTAGAGAAAAPPSAAVSSEAAVSSQEGAAVQPPVAPPAPVIAVVDGASVPAPAALLAGEWSLCQCVNHVFSTFKKYGLFTLAHCKHEHHNRIMKRNLIFM
jgi:hypothetical protein